MRAHVQSSMYFIHEGKVRAPAAAMALIERVGA